MSRQQIEHLLQQCLEGYEAGLTPDECLSAYPHARTELEPLLRQALSLRVAFAATPSEEFRSRVRERVLFAAGSDVSQALSVEPDPEFIADSRQRFLKAAGAQAQEALRDVPPPRLPFWVNARRRLLDTAASPSPRRGQAFAPGLRYALSAGVVALAIVVAALGFFLIGSPGSGPNGTKTATAADLDYLEQQLSHVEQQRALGQPVATSQIVELTQLTSDLAKQPDAPVLEKLPALIDRQKEVVNTVAATQPAPELVQAQQQLNEAEVRVAAARADTPVPPSQTPSATSTGIAAAVTKPSATPQPTATPNVTPSTPREPVSAANLQPNQVLTQIDPTDTTSGLIWVRISTSKMTFVIPNSWKVFNIESDSQGFAVLNNGIFGIDPGLSEMPVIIVSVSEGEINTVVDGKQVTLRSEGPDGAVIDPAKLLELTDGQVAPLIYHFATSLKFTP